MSRRLAASFSSSKIIEVKAKKVALQEKMKFRAAIAEQEREFEELNVQEAVYQQAEDEENKTDDTHKPLLPSDTHYVMKKFLNDSQPKAFSTPVTALSMSTDMTTSSTLRSTFTIANAAETVKLSTHVEQIDPLKVLDTSYKTSTEYTAPGMHRDTTVSYSQGRQMLPVFPTPRLDPWSRPFLTTLATPTNQCTLLQHRITQYY